MLMDTVSAALVVRPSKVFSSATYVPGLSTVNTGDTELGLLNAAVLPDGRERNVQMNNIWSPSASVLALPFSVMFCPTVALWSGPALACGGVLSVLTFIVAGELLRLPSDTTNCAA